MDDRKKNCILALDAMGGDHAPLVVFEGAINFLIKNPDVSCVFYGPIDILKTHYTPLIDKHPSLKHQIDLQDAPDVITNNTKTVAAVRLRNSSLRLALTSIKEGKADAVVSGGNTGAYMALSKLILGMIEGIDRPAIPAIIPTLKDWSVMLDLGANVDCTADNLIQFAYMGEAFARQILGRESPAIGILNVGSEEMKGDSIVQKAAQVLREDSGLRFYGFVEGNDITAGTTDVIVTDGFSGNVALKTLEGASRLMVSTLRQSLRESLFGIIGSFIARPAFKAFRERLDPRFHNGAAFLGVKGIAVKSHGGMDAFGFENALKGAHEMVQSNFIPNMEERLKKLRPS